MSKRSREENVKEGREKWKMREIEEKIEKKRKEKKNRHEERRRCGRDDM
jgi:hypothetical protein